MAGVDFVYISTGGSDQSGFQIVDILFQTTADCAALIGAATNGQVTVTFLSNGTPLGSATLTGPPSDTWGNDADPSNPFGAYWVDGSGTDNPILLDQQLVDYMAAGSGSLSGVNEAVFAGGGGGYPFYQLYFDAGSGSLAVDFLDQSVQQEVVNSLQSGETYTADGYVAYGVNESRVITFTLNGNGFSGDFPGGPGGSTIYYIYFPGENITIISNESGSKGLDQGVFSSGSGGGGGGGGGTPTAPVSIDGGSGSTFNNIFFSNRGSYVIAIGNGVAYSAPYSNLSSWTDLSAYTQYESMHIPNQNWYYGYYDEDNYRLFLMFSSGTSGYDGTNTVYWYQFNQADPGGGSLSTSGSFTLPFIVKELKVLQNFIDNHVANTPNYYITEENGLTIAGVTTASAPNNNSFTTQKSFGDSATIDKVYATASGTYKWVMLFNKGATYQYATTTSTTPTSTSNWTISSEFSQPTNNAARHFGYDSGSGNYFWPNGYSVNNITTNPTHTARWNLYFQDGRGIFYKKQWGTSADKELWIDLESGLMNVTNGTNMASNGDHLIGFGGHSISYGEFRPVYYDSANNTIYYSCVGAADFASGGDKLYSLDLTNKVYKVYLLQHTGSPNQPIGLVLKNSVLGQWQLVNNNMQQQYTFVANNLSTYMAYPSQNSTWQTSIFLDTPYPWPGTIPADSPLNSGHIDILSTLGRNGTRPYNRNFSNTQNINIKAVSSSIGGVGTRYIDLDPISTLTARPQDGQSPWSWYGNGGFAVKDYKVIDDGTYTKRIYGGNYTMVQWDAHSSTEPFTNLVAPDSNTGIGPKYGCKIGGNASTSLQFYGADSTSTVYVNQYNASRAFYNQNARYSLNAGFYVTAAQYDPAANVFYVARTSGTGPAGFLIVTPASTSSATSTSAAYRYPNIIDGVNIGWYTQNEGLASNYTYHFTTKIEILGDYVYFISPSGILAYDKTSGDPTDGLNWKIIHWASNNKPYDASRQATGAAVYDRIGYTVANNDNSVFITKFNNRSFGRSTDGYTYKPLNIKIDDTEVFNTATLGSYPINNGGGPTDVVWSPAHERFVLINEGAMFVSDSDGLEWSIKPFTISLGNTQFANSGAPNYQYNQFITKSDGLLMISARQDGGINILQSES